LNEAYYHLDVIYSSTYVIDGKDITYS